MYELINIGEFLFVTYIIIAIIHNIYKELFKTKKCPYCKEKIPKDATVCKHCQRSVEAITEPAKTEKTEKIQPDEMITCKICNHEIPINSKTCMYCGTKEFH